MASMKWIKPSPETIQHFERIAPGAPLETRSMFGMPCRFLNGHMLVGVFQNSIMLRLSEEDCELCIRAGARPFQPMGREMKGYVELSPGTFDDATLKQWIARGMRFIGSLPPKLKQPVPRTAAGRSPKSGSRRVKTALERPAKKLVAKKASAATPARKKGAAKRPTKSLRRSGSKRRILVRTPRRRTARRECRRAKAVSN